MPAMTWDELDTRLEAVPGCVSVHVGRLGASAAYRRLADTTHYAASTMKTAVLVALHRAAEAGRLDLDAPVPVVAEFASAQPGAPRFACDPRDDNDPEVWGRLGGSASLRRLAHRMIVRSSNLATCLVMSHVGLPAVAEVWALAGARHSVTTRAVGDLAARDGGLTNLVTAADLAALHAAIVQGAEQPGPLASPAACAQMRDVLLAQEIRDDLPAGLPAGTRIAHKNGWVHGIRHGAGVVLPDDAPPYAIAVCTTAATADGGPAYDDATARRLIATVSATAWAARHRL